MHLFPLLRISHLLARRTRSGGFCKWTCFFCRFPKCRTGQLRIPFGSNCGYGQGASVLDVIAAVGHAAATKIPLRMGQRRPGDPAALVANANRIKKVLGWRPRHDNLQTIVGHALAGGAPTSSTKIIMKHSFKRRACALPFGGSDLKCLHMAHGSDELFYSAVCA